MVLALVSVGVLVWPAHAAESSGRLAVVSPASGADAHSSLQAAPIGKVHALGRFAPFANLTFGYDDGVPETLFGSGNTTYNTSAPAVWLDRFVLLPSRFPLTITDI